MGDVNYIDIDDGVTNNKFPLVLSQKHNFKGNR